MSLASIPCSPESPGHAAGRLAVKDAAVIGTGLHHQGEGRKLSRPVVDLQAEEVLLQDQPRNVLGPVAPLLVDRLEQVVGFDQDVAGAAGRVEQRQFFGVQARRA